MNKVRKIVAKARSDIGLTFARQIVSALCNLGVVLLIANKLGSFELGVFSITLVLPQLMASLFGFGISAANIFFLSRIPKSHAVIWATTFRCIACISLVGSSIAVIFVFVFGDILFNEIPLETIYFGLILFPATLLNSNILAFFQARQDFKTFNLLVLISPFLVLVIALFATLFTDFYSLNFQIFLSVLVPYFVAILGLIKLSQTTPLFQANFSKRYLRLALSYGLKVHLGRIATLLITRIDLLMVNFFLGASSAGVYTVAVRLTEQIWMISNAVSIVVFPKLSANEKKNDGLNISVARLSRRTLQVTSGVSIGLAIAGYSLIPILFGAGFENAYFVLLYLLPGIVLFSSSRIIANQFAAKNLVHINLRLTLVTLVANTIFNLLLIPNFGLSGAAFATSLAYSFNLLFRLVFVNNFMDEPWRHYIWLPTKR